MIIFLCFFFLYYLTSGGHTPYDYFTRLAEAFLKGRMYLSENPPWLNELIPAINGGYFVAYPPMPAIFAIPFVTLFGKYFHQEILAHFIGAFMMVFIFKLAFTISKKMSIAIWATTLAGAGSIIWFLASNGSAWYLGQLTAAFFLTASLLEVVTKRRALLIGILFGAAYLSRVNLAIIFPFFLLFFAGKDWKKNTFLFVSGLIPFIVFNCSYNFLRFGTILDKGYLLIPGVLAEPWYTKGILHPNYIVRHLKVLFLELPTFSRSLPYIKPSWAGMAIWITTPAFIYVFFAPLKQKLVKLSWMAITLTCLIIFSHGTTGFAQFGYRFAVDFYPFLILLTIKGVAKTGLKWHHWVLLVVGVVVNLWGVIFINKFGWVGF